MPQIRGEKKLRRTLVIPGVVGDVAIEISAEGITFRPKGMKLPVTTTWPEVINVCSVPENAPPKFHNRPLEFLQRQAEKQIKSRAMRVEQKISAQLAQPHRSSQHSELVH